MRAGTNFHTLTRMLTLAALIAFTAAAVNDLRADDRGPSRSRDGLLLVIMPEGFENTAPMNEYISWREGQGLDVDTHVVTAGTSNTALRSYIQGLWGPTYKPDYILLIGDTSGTTSGTWTIPHFVGEASRHGATDLPYACMDAGDDWDPDTTIGRFSVTGESQLQDVIDKTIFVETGDFSDPDYVKRGAFLATDDQTAGAEQTHDRVIDNYLAPNGYEGIRIYARLGGNTYQVANAVNNGCLFVTYGGHSSSSGWWAPSFDQGDVQSLYNTGLYGLAFGWSCNTAHYTYSECFGETWLRVANRGAAAYLSASDYIYWGDWEAWEPARQLEVYFFQSFFRHDIWEVGPAWRLALAAFKADFGSVPGNEDVTRNFFEMMTLLGDPALMLPRPLGFNLFADPEIANVCAPPAYVAEYTIDVEPVAGLADPVTLSATGMPAGSTVEFSVNDAVPPFSTTMTIVNVQPGSPGHYEIDVIGTSADHENSITVELNLADAVPGEVSLVSPAKDAIDVPRDPTLIWEPSSQTVEYDLRLATDEEFNNIVYEVTTTETSHEIEEYLLANTLYFWQVRAVNACGDSGFCEPYNFLTVPQAQYFTELFSEGGIDLAYRTLEFTPDGSADYYYVCGYESDTLPVHPSGGTVLDLGGNDYEQVLLAGSRTVPIYGLSYTSFYVGSNGYVTFTAGDIDYTPTLTDHFDTRRISALFNNLNPASGGTVSWQQMDDRAVVTFEDVPEYPSSGANTFQIEMFFDGMIRVTWLGVSAADGLIGLSAGDGVPADFVASDLSAAGPCGPRAPSAANQGVTTQMNVPLAITLTASDDGQPNPPGMLSYIITSLPTVGTLRDPEAGVISAVPYTLVDGGNELTYTPDSWHIGTDGFHFIANDGGTPPDGGDSNEAIVLIEIDPPDPSMLLDFNFDSDPGWSTEGMWAYGQPLGGGSHNNDPTSGHTGDNVYGYNLYGDYTSNMPPRHLTTTAIDCANLAELELRFWRWLGVERDPFDFATVAVSNDGVNWTELWANPEDTVSDTEWSQMVFDISAVADGQPTVYVRWTMGPTDATNTYPGWNIDDVEFWGVRLAPQCHGDLDGDGDIDLADLAQLLANYGATSGATYMDGDLDDDGDVDLGDLAALLAVYGTPC